MSDTFVACGVIFSTISSIVFGALMMFDGIVESHLNSFVIGSILLGGGIYVASLIIREKI